MVQAARVVGDCAHEPDGLRLMSPSVRCLHEEMRVHVGRSYYEGRHREGRDGEVSGGGPRLEQNA